MKILANVMCKAVVYLLLALQFLCWFLSMPSFFVLHRFLLCCNNTVSIFSNVDIMNVISFM